MKEAGQIVLFRFPRTNLTERKLRPALLLAELPGPYKDWLICMIPSRTHQYIEGLDEIISETDIDFTESGLKTKSAIRIARLAVVEDDILRGAIGNISGNRLQRLKTNLVKWIAN